jgi:hypothetical protein
MTGEPLIILMIASSHGMEETVGLHIPLLKGEGGSRQRAG